jgi:broad specificity phosphatase PhoE
MVIKVPDLREMNFGAIEGMTYEEIQIRYPREYGLWLEDIGSSNILEGESMRDLKGRVLSAFDAIVSDDGDRSLAIVTHAGPISVILNSIVRSDDFWGMMPNPASLSLIEFEDGLPKIVVVNDTSHLTNT